MNSESRVPQTGSREPAAPGALAAAAHFWERRRIPYNLVLGLCFAAWVVGSWPHFRAAFTLIHLLQLLFLALLANVCYCAAYLAELLAHLATGSRQRDGWRWALWTAGMLFAILVENYWIADEIYPFVN